MSTLLKLRIPERVVRVSDDEGFVVRGLSPLDVVALYERHAGELEPMFQRIMAGVRDNGGEAKAQDLEPLVLSLLKDTPILLAELIAVASGGNPSDDSNVSIPSFDGGEDLFLPAFIAAVEVAKRLPFPVQLEALSAIGDLTFTSAMPPGKFFALVTTLAKKVTGAMENATSLAMQQSGSGAFDGTSAS
jgi:hypothetical protein